MRVMTVAETAEALGLTVEGLITLRLAQFTNQGIVFMPVTVEEIDLIARNSNALQEKYNDMKVINNRAYEFVRQHRDEDGADDGSMALSEEQVDALMSILRGVE